MTPPSDIDTVTTPGSTTDLKQETNAQTGNLNQNDGYLNELPDEVEMSLFDH